MWICLPGHPGGGGGDRGCISARRATPKQLSWRGTWSAKQRGTGTDRWVEVEVERKGQKVGGTAPWGPAGSEVMPAAAGRTGRKPPSPWGPHLTTTRWWSGRREEQDGPKCKSPNRNKTSGNIWLKVGVERKRREIPCLGPLEDLGPGLRGRQPTRPPPPALGPGGPCHSRGSRTWKPPLGCYPAAEARHPALDCYPAVDAPVTRPWTVTRPWIALLPGLGPRAGPSPPKVQSARASGTKRGKEQREKGKIPRAACPRAPSYPAPILCTRSPPSSTPPEPPANPPRPRQAHPPASPPPGKPTPPPASPPRPPEFQLPPGQNPSPTKLPEATVHQPPGPAPSSAFSPKHPPGPSSRPHRLPPRQFPTPPPVVVPPTPPKAKA